MKVLNTGLVLAFSAAALVAGAASAAAATTTGTVHDRCERGEFCLWPNEAYQGVAHRVSLDNANPGECVPLPDGFDARSFANRTTRPVTVYQNRDCATESEFATYPGGGTFVPAAPHLVRGVQIWER